jgi:uncharacterized repeat protein (TIGR02543 family)
LNKLSITKKRISAFIFAIILLLTAAMIPTMKVSAALNTLPTRDQQAALDKLCDVTQVDVDVAALQGGSGGINFIGSSANIGYDPTSYNTNAQPWTQNPDTGAWAIGGAITLTVDNVAVPGIFSASGTVNATDPMNIIMSGTATFTAFTAVFSVGTIDVTISGGQATDYSFSNISMSATTYMISVQGGENNAEVLGGLTYNNGYITVGASKKEGYTFDGWYLDEARTIPFDSGRRYFYEIILYAKFTENPAPEPAPIVNQGPPDIVYQPITPINPPPAAEDLETTTPGTLTPGGEVVIEKTTPAADVEISGEISEEGTMTLVISGTEVETSSTSAAAAIAAGEATEVVTSGNAVAVVTTDGGVIAGANESGSMNSASTLAALGAAAAKAELGDEVKIAAGADVSAISAATINKLLAAAEEAGVDAVITAAATDETGAAIAEIDIPLVGETKTSIKTGITLVDDAIDEAVAEREKASGVTVLASFKTEQKTSFGTKVTFSFDTETLGLDGAKDGDTYYVAIKRGDGKTVQVKATVAGGKLVFTTASAGVMMISNEKFTK